MAVTIKDVAARANVSFQAVSAVLGGKENCRVSAAKRAEIVRIAADIG